MYVPTFEKATLRRSRSKPRTGETLESGGAPIKTWGESAWRARWRKWWKWCLFTCWRDRRSSFCSSSSKVLQAPTESHKRMLPTWVWRNPPQKILRVSGFYHHLIQRLHHERKSERTLSTERILSPAVLRCNTCAWTKTLLIKSEFQSKSFFITFS